MTPRVSVITLAVDDLPRAVRFYRDGLGLATSGIIGDDLEPGSVAFFELQVGLKLALWSRQSLARETGLSLGIRDPTECVLSHNVGTKVEVDIVIQCAALAGATITRPAHDTFWGGYAGFFQDPDQHLWEIVWNPKHAADCGLAQR